MVFAAAAAADIDRTAVDYGGVDVENEEDVAAVDFVEVEVIVDYSFDVERMIVNCEEAMVNALKVNQCYLYYYY